MLMLKLCQVAFFTNRAVKAKEELTWVSSQFCLKLSSHIHGAIPETAFISVFRNVITFNLMSFSLSLM